MASIPQPSRLTFVTYQIELALIGGARPRDNNTVKVHQTRAAIITQQLSVLLVVVFISL